MTLPYENDVLMIDLSWDGESKSSNEVPMLDVSGGGESGGEDVYPNDIDMVDVTMESEPPSTSRRELMKLLQSTRTNTHMCTREHIRFVSPRQRRRRRREVINKPTLLLLHCRKARDVTTPQSQSPPPPQPHSPPTTTTPPRDSSSTERRACLSRGLKPFCLPRGRNRSRMLTPSSATGVVTVTIASACVSSRNITDVMPSSTAGLMIKKPVDPPPSHIPQGKAAKSLSSPSSTEGKGACKTPPT
ncbi:hypothetical protein GWK47_040821 [Chionoecetes opilio]|uniref:Uncharacterized protein n=1 Tax=Chionoecetes opilio TaxID=41210 RepID=A0A8J4YAD8_CHIOP|nr:hypothetical protein GWK47_040821 [Chionoecetes opilio]